MTNEQELMLELCKFRHPDGAKIKSILMTKPDLSVVLGYLMLNRAAGAAYMTLCRTETLSMTDPIFRKTLEKVYHANKRRTRAYKKAVQQVDEILKECHGSYAMLKGALLCAVYPEGLRTSNDIDLLIEKKNLSKIENALKAAGLKQGMVKNGKFVPATRKEIIFAGMMKGETVPYVLETVDPALGCLEIDLNFALGYQNEAPEPIHAMLDAAVRKKISELEIDTLNKDDFILHLCAHLYKEAVAYPWIQMGRDLCLYKFMDLYLLTDDYGKPAFDRLARRMKEIGCENACLYALTYTKALFGSSNEALERFLEANQSTDSKLLHKVQRPELKTTLIYTESDLIMRFFAPNRKALLKEASE